MQYGRVLIFSLVVWGLATSSLYAKREGSPLRAEIEVYSGGLMSDNVGAAFNSIGKGAYGARFGLGFTRFLNFDLNYAFSDQKSLLVADTGTGLAAVRTGNWHFGAVNSSFHLVQRKRVTFYISPRRGIHPDRRARHLRGRAGRGRFRAASCLHAAELQPGYGI